jgi:LuxR family maltose regulon positive regulatory protein
MRAALTEGTQSDGRALTLAAPCAESPFGLFELCMAACVQAGVAMAQGELCCALEMLNQARSWAEQAHSPLARAYAVARTSQLGIAQGQLKEALVQLRAALSDLREQHHGLVAQAPLACTLITALYEANAVDEAMACFHQFHALIVEAALPEDLVMCYRSVIRIHDAHGRPERALELLDEGERTAYARRWPRAVQQIQQERVRRALQHGHVACARRLAQTALGALPPCVPGWTSWSEEADGPVLGALRLMLHTGQAELALVYIDRKSVV